MMKIALGGRAAEQLVFGRVTNGAATDLEKVTEIARAMVFDYGMSVARLGADDARRQLRALGGDEADARLRAGSAHRRGLRGGAAAALQAPAHARPDRARRCSRRRRSTAHELRELLARARARVARLRDDGHREGASVRSNVRIGRVQAARYPPSRRRGRTISTRPSARTCGSSAAGSSIAPRFRIRASRRRRCCVGAGRVELLAAARRRHARRQVPREARPRHAPRRLRGRRRRAPRSRSSRRTAPS